MADEHSNEEIDVSSMPKEIWWRDLYLYQWKGFWFRLSHLPGIQGVMNGFNPLPSDVILTSFPKTGTTWLKALLYSIINRSSMEMVKKNHPHEIVPVLELQVYGEKTEYRNVTTSGSSTRLFHTHIPYQLLEKKFTASNCRIIYVTRNPKDTLISMWHFQGNNEYFAGLPVKDAMDKFCRGIVPFGPYYDHVLGYWKESQSRPENVFFITYEELKQDTKNQVKKLASFIGCHFGENEEELVEDIVRSCSFEHLSTYEANKSTNLPTWIELPYNSFFRKGEVGDHKRFLNKKMIEQIDEKTVEKFHASGFMFGI